MHELRARLRGETREPDILAKKRPSGNATDSLDPAGIRRSVSRTNDTRADTRHRLDSETVDLQLDDEIWSATLINLSGGGAMVEVDAELPLFAAVQLHLAEEHRVPCSVRWLKGSLAGLEFESETKLECSAEDVAKLVQEVIRRTFPDLEIAKTVGWCSDGRAARAQPRHDLVWSGILNYDFQRQVVRLRNVSPTGALIEFAGELPVGAKPVLEIGDAAIMDCQVVWRFGDVAGLRFESKFNLSLLGTTMPRFAQAGRTSDDKTLVDLDDLSPGELQVHLEGFLKY